MKANIQLCSIFMLFVGVLSERSAATPEKELHSSAATSRKAETLPSIETHVCKTNETQELWRKVQVLCMVMTSEPNHRKRAEHIRHTWGSRCNNLIFISNATDYFLPSVVLEAHVWSDRKPDLKSAFKYAYQYYFEDVDWIVKAEDESFLVIENLRHLLSIYNPSRKLYMGYRVKGEEGISYMLGKAGYVLSKGSLRALVEEGFLGQCNEDNEYGDAEIGRCLNKLGVEIVDTRDSGGRHRFLPYSPGLFMKPFALSHDDPVWTDSYYPLRTGFECCSKTWISAWTNLPQLLYLYEYMSHNIRLSICQTKNTVIPPSGLVNDSLYLELNLTFSNGVVIQKGRENIYLPPFLQEAVAQLKDHPDSQDSKNSKTDTGYSHDVKLSKSDGKLSKSSEAYVVSSDNAKMVPRKLDYVRELRVLCMVMTSDLHHEGRVVHVKSTWGRRCSLLVFMSNRTDNSLSAVNVVEGLHSPYHPWLKTKSALQYVYDHYLDRVDWVLKIEDQSYVVYENMLSLLLEYNPSEKLYLGCRFKNRELKNGYMTVEAGSILSRAAVKAFVEKSLNSELCRQGDGGAEDVLMSRCLQSAGVRLIDTRDNLARFRFLPLSVEYYLMPGAMSLPTFDWWFERVYYIQHIGFECCSSSVVALSHVASVNMYLYDFFLYQFKLANATDNNVDVMPKENGTKKPKFHFNNRID